MVVSKSLYMLKLTAPLATTSIACSYALAKSAR